MKFKGWTIVMTMAVVLAIAFALVWETQGITKTSTLFLVRVTARTSFTAFLLAFIASSVQRLWKSPLSLWLLQNRKFFGLSMAVSHTYHAVVFTMLAVVFGERSFLDAIALAALGYVFLIAMTITSFPQPAKAIGRRAWKILHTAGMYYFWLIFAEEYFARLILAEKFTPIATKDTLSYAVLSLLVMLGLVVRIVGRKKKTASNQQLQDIPQV